MKQNLPNLNIHKDQLKWFLTIFLNEREIFQLLTRTNLFTDPDRLHSSSTQELLNSLTTAFYQHSCIVEKVTQHLTQKVEAAISRVGFMVIDEIHTYFKSPGQLIETGEFGDVVWALLADSREEVREHGYRLLNVAYEEDDSSEHVTSLQNVSLENPESQEIETNEQENQTEIIDDVQSIHSAVDENNINDSRIDNLLLQKTKHEKKIKLLEQHCNYLIEENEVFKGKLVNNQEKDQQIALLQQENEGLQEKASQFLETQDAFERLEKDHNELLKDNQKINTQLNSLSQLKQAKEAFQVELKLVEEAIYNEKSTLDQLKVDLQGHFELIEKRNETSRTALNQIRQTVGQFEGSPLELPFDVKNESSQPRVGVFVDVQNMFYAAKDRFERRVDYIKLLDLIVGPRQLISAFAYIVQIPEIKQGNFISLLEHNGYTIRSKDLRLRGDGSAKGDWDVGIAVDVVSMLGTLDVVILASGDGDFCPLAELIKQQQKRIEVVAFEHNTSMDLQAMADQFFPIGEELLM